MARESGTGAAGGSTRVTKLKVKINGQEIADDQLKTVTVDQDIDQPDMAMVMLNNQGHANTDKYHYGESVEVDVEDGSATIFKGEIVGIEPIYEVGGDTRIIIRAFNRLHRLLRGRKSKTYLDQSDQDIVNSIASDNGLTADCDTDPQITHKYVYQHNQNDMEFLRLRANRIGFDVLVEDTTLKFKKGEGHEESGVELIYGDPGAEYALQRFLPRISTAAQVKKVIVRGWDPEKKEEIVGEAEASSSRLGADTGVSKAETFGDKITYTVDHPIFSKEEADAIAKARLGELMMGYITDEGQAMGHAKYKPGAIVKVKVNPGNASDPVNGKYLIVGTQHRYSHSSSGGGSGSGGSGAGGYTTLLRVRRDAQGPS
jgi:phage protein D